MLKKTGNGLRLKPLLCAAILLVSLFPSAGFGFDVTAHVDKTRISLEDSVLLTISVAGGKAGIDLSAIKGFNVISRGSSSSYHFSNGRSEIKADYQYVLTPLSKGVFTIPAIRVVMDGQTGFTKPIEIHVSDSPAGPDDVKPLFATAEVSKSNLFAGEQALFSLKFFTSKRLSGLGFEKPPEFSGFSSKPLDREKNYTQTINGVNYHVTQVDYILVPATPGTFRIDPAVLIAQVVMESSKSSRFDSFFNDSFFSTSHFKPVRVMSNPVDIQVDPVPPYLGQEKFSGLLGRFDIAADIDKTDLAKGESATLTITISGIGNIMDATLMPMDLNPDAFKVYDDNPVETINLTEKGFQGSKVFKRAIVPKNPGKFTIGPVYLVYFDVDQKAFKTVSTQPILLDVRPSEEMRLAANPLNGTTGNPPVKQEVSLVNQDILEIKEGVEVLENWQEIHFLLFVLLLFVPAILFSGLKLFIRVAEKDLPVERIMQEKAREHLIKAGKMDSQDSAFSGHLYSSLVALIFSKGKKRGESITIHEARTILADAGVDEADTGRIIHLLETIESIRFGRTKIDKDRAKALLENVKKSIKIVVLALVCGGTIFIAPQKAAAIDTATFSDGIKCYQQGDFKQAAQKFESIAKAGIKNPYLFYNIGNAYLKADDIGHAMLWYERAKRMIPSDPDLRFNLAYASTLVKDKKEETVDMMGVLFFWDNLITLKTIQITAIGFSFVFFAWACFRLVKKQAIFSGTGMILCSLFVLVSAIAVITCYNQTALRAAVIVKEEVAVRSGVTDTATKLFDLHAGTRVTVQDTKAGYIKILFSKGRIGWIKADQAIVI